MMKKARKKATGTKKINAAGSSRRGIELWKYESITFILGSLLFHTRDCLNIILIVKHHLLWLKKELCDSVVTWKYGFSTIFVCIFPFYRTSLFVRWSGYQFLPMKFGGKCFDRWMNSTNRNERNFEWTFISIGIPCSFSECFTTFFIVAKVSSKSLCENSENCLGIARYKPIQNSLEKWKLWDTI